MCYMPGHIQLNVFTLSYSQEDFRKRPKLATLLSTLSHYDAAIPPPKGDASKEEQSNSQQVRSTGSAHSKTVALWVR